VGGNEERLRQLATRQRGLFTRTQARGCGYSAYQVRRRLETHDWQVVLGPVFAFRGIARTPALVDRAAALAVPGGVLAGPSAARVHGLPVDDPRSWIALPPAARLRIRELSVLRDRLSRYDVEFVDGVLVTGRPRTVFDCLRILPERRAGELLDRALQQRWITLDDLAGRVRAFAGRHGVSRLVDLVAAASTGTRSAAEHLTAQMLKRSGVLGWRANVPIHDGAGRLIGIGDFVFGAERVVVELDGRAFHTTSDRFERDRQRQNQLIGAGWVVLRFTWRDLTQRPAYVVATIRQILQDRRSGNGSRSGTAQSVPETAIKPRPRLADRRGGAASARPPRARTT
jgi:very-short-patch-repair endonuclease